MVAKTSRTAVRRRRAPLPAVPQAMLATLVARPFDHPDWIFEPKFDGLRILARFDGDHLKLLSRNGKSQDAEFPDIAAALRASLHRPAIVDGEVVCFDANGQTSFRLLQQRFHLKDPREIRARAERYPAFIYLFDILYLDGADITDVPLAQRKQLLHEAVCWSDRVRWTDYQAGHGTELFRQACRQGSEGIIGKQLSSRYQAGRSPAWVKIKCIGRQEFVIGGFTDPQRSRVGLGALLVGYYDPDGKQLIYAGKVGTGYTHGTLLDLRERLDRLEHDAMPFADDAAPRGDQVHWVRPRLVAEIAFAEWTQNGLLRQPRFEGLRPDKSPHECRRERPQATERVRSRAETAAAGNGTASSGDPAMALETYRAKRDFAQTPEPAGRAHKGSRRSIFVIQEHHASRLHYDFRLEVDGVLNSWAVPKEPSLDPAQKRLAVQVEDHPLEYATFKGSIPEGQYGAGTVSIWDHGTYDNLLAEKPEPLTMAQGIEAGRLEFRLHGERLKGRFALVRMQGRKQGKKVNWLLIKMKDEFVQSGPAEGNGSAHAAPRRKASARVRHPAKARSPSAGEEVAPTHPDKVLYPDAGFTKRDVFEFYREIAPRLLPYLRDRPMTLERLPEGLGEDKPHFWQKHTPTYYPDWIPRIELPSENGKPVQYTLVNDLPTLLYLVNQGALTFHVWFSRVQDLDRPDFVLFDLDPGQASFGDLVAVARKLHTFLEDEDRPAYVKTSGKTGLHILVPWEADGGHDEARAWALTLAERVVETLPDQATVERSKATRGRRVYVDVMQNARGHHAVPPYVLRPVPRAPVSTPLHWREVTPRLDPARFNLKTVFRRLRQADPMAPLARQFATP